MANQYERPSLPSDYFQPALVSSPAIRERVPSSGYGRELPRAKDPSPTPLSADETFSPTLSNPDLRAKAPSSGYGVAVPKPKQELDQPEDPEATFAPQLSNPDLRLKVGSSGYGSVVATPPARVEPEALSFTPEITMTELAKSLRDKAPSQGYGEKILHKTVHEEPEINRDEFNPKLPEDPIREKVMSSGYLKPNYTPEIKPRAPPIRVERALLSRKKEDNPEVEVKKDPILERRESGFRLDCVAVAGQTSVQPRSHRDRPQTAPTPIVTDHARQIKATARSQGYGKSYTPPRGEKPAPKEAETSLVFNRRSTLTPQEGESRPLVQTPEALTIKAKFNENARGSGYGSATYQPPKGEKKEIVSEPTFHPTKGVAGIPDSGAPPQPRRLKSATNVRSSGYASGYTPPKGEKKQVLSFPGFKPAGKSGYKNMADMDPAPRSSLNNTVASHGYGMVSPTSASRTETEIASDMPAGFDPQTF